MDAETEANRLFQTLHERCRALTAQFGKPTEIPLSVYETDHDLATLRPEDGGRWTAAFHRAVMESLAARLREKGFTVRLVPLDAAAYFRWLAAGNHRNTPDARAQFIGLPRND